MRLILAMLLASVIGCTATTKKPVKVKHVTRKVTVVKTASPDLRALAPVLKESADAP